MMRTDYNWDEVLHRLYRAMQRVLDNDHRLLEYGPSERAVAHRLAVYVEHEFPGWHIDCEYNRQGGGTDRKQIPTEDGDKNADPDIIVHERGEPLNLLAIEVKPVDGDQRKIDYDVVKLQGYAQAHHYGYAVLVMYSTGRGASFVDPIRVA